jgi:hypothetical protein
MHELPLGTELGLILLHAPITLMISGTRETEMPSLVNVKLTTAGDVRLAYTNVQTTDLTEMKMGST